MKIMTLFLIVSAFLFLVDVQVVSSQEASGSLINKNGFCLARGFIGNQLVQTTCNRLLNWWGYSDLHICDVTNRCVASPLNSAGNTNVIRWDWLPEKGQRFTFEKDEATG